MKRFFGIALFMLIFSIVYAFGHYFALSTMSMLFNIEMPYLVVFVFLFPISFILSTTLERYSPNVVSKVFYILNAVEMGFMFFLFVLTVVYRVMAIFFSFDKVLAGIVILGLAVVVSVYAIIHASRIYTVNISVITKGIKKHLRLVQLSDVHLGTIRNHGYLKKILSKIQEINPDIVVITGDLFDGTAPLHPKMVDQFNTLSMPIYFVTGNHELYEHYDQVLPILNSTKIRVLRNEAITCKGLQIIGVDYGHGSEYLESVLRTIDIEPPSVLLYHVPVQLSVLEKYKINLHLAGHTHNGQLFPFGILTRLFYSNIHGLKSSKKSAQYVSAGTGTWGPPMRLGTKSEITVIDLVS